MTENIPQTSASDRYEAARKALAEYDENERKYQSLPDSEKEGRNYEHYEDGLIDAAETLARALRALIIPPPTGETVEAIALRVSREATDLPDGIPSEADVRKLISRGVRAGINDAHCTWEPADHPSQEMMLRWLGIEHNADPVHSTKVIYIHEQFIEKEVI